MPPRRRLQLVSPNQARAFLKRAPDLDTWLVDAHGRYPSKREQFTVPRDTAIVFLTMPGCPLSVSRSSSHPTRYMSNLVKHGDLSMGALGTYATMYVPGDVIDDMFLTFDDDAVNDLGIERVPAGDSAAGKNAKFVPGRCFYLSTLASMYGGGVYVLATCRTGTFAPDEAASLRALNLLARERFRPTTVSPTSRFAELVRPDLDPRQLRNALAENLSFPRNKTGREARQAVRVAHVPKPRGTGVAALAKRVLRGILRPRNATLQKEFDTPNAAAALRRYILRKSKAYGQKEHNRLNRAFAARHPNVARESNVEYDMPVLNYLWYKSKKAINPDAVLYDGENYWYDARSDLNAAHARPKRRRRKTAQTFNAAAAAYYRTAQP